MKIYTLDQELRLPISLRQAWDFFSTPANLPLITPDWLNFRITSELPPEMYPGLIITYKVRPVLRIPVTWVTEITQVERYRYFIDEQRVGPYRMWHHEHHFTEIPGGVRMRDIVHYGLPFGQLGRIAHMIMVQRSVTEIFTFRTRRLEERFGLMPQTADAHLSLHT